MDMTIVMGMTIGMAQILQNGMHTLGIDPQILGDELRIELFVLVLLFRNALSNMSQISDTSQKLVRS